MDLSLLRMGLALNCFRASKQRIAALFIQLRINNLHNARVSTPLSGE